MNTHHVNAETAAADPVWCRVRSCQYPAALVLKVAVEVTYHRGTVGEAEYWTERREDWAVCQHHRKVAGSRVRGSRSVRPSTALFCGCESALCDHTNPANPDGESTAEGQPWVFFCRRIPTGLVTSDWIGDVCDECARLAEARGFRASIHRFTSAAERAEFAADAAEQAAAEQAAYSETVAAEIAEYDRAEAEIGAGYEARCVELLGGAGNVASIIDRSRREPGPFPRLRGDEG